MNKNNVQPTGGLDLDRFLSAEIARLKQRNRKAMIGGCALLLIVGLYLTFVTGFICSQVLDPKGAAQWVAYMAEQNLPVAMVETERTLTAQAPALAEQVMAGMPAIPGYIAAEARHQVDLVVDEVLPELSRELTLTLEDHFDSNAGDAHAFLAEHTNPELVDAFVDQITSDIATHLDEELRAESNGGLQHVTFMTLDALDVIDAQIEHLCTTTPENLTRQDWLQRRLVLLCLQSLDQLTLKSRASGPLYAPTGAL